MAEKTYGTRRKTLSGRNGISRKLIDMEEVYALIDKGVTVKEVAESLGVGASTLYRHHRRYQNQLESLDKLANEGKQGGAGAGLLEELNLNLDLEDL